MLLLFNYLPNMPGNRGRKKKISGGYRSRYEIGYGDRKLSYKYRYRPGSHVPGHMIDNLTGEEVYLPSPNTRIGGFVDMESKFVDIETNGDPFAITWATMENATALCISGVAQGDGESERDGRVYHLTSIHVKYIIHTLAVESSGTPLPTVHGRVCIVWDKQTNAAQLDATDVMDAGGTDDILSFRNLQFTQRFNVMYDKPFILKRYGQTNEGAINLFASGICSTNVISFNKSFARPVKVTCTGTGGTVAAINDNSFHCIGIGNTTALQLNMIVRCRFVG